MVYLSFNNVCLAAEAAREQRKARPGIWRRCATRRAAGRRGTGPRHEPDGQGL